MYYYSADKGEKDPTPVLQAHERFNLKVKLNPRSSPFKFYEL